MIRQISRISERSGIRITRMVRCPHRLVDSAVDSGGGGHDGIHRAALSVPSAKDGHRVDGAHELRSQGASSWFQDSLTTATIAWQDYKSGSITFFSGRLRVRQPWFHEPEHAHVFDCHFQICLAQGSYRARLRHGIYSCALVTSGP